jgi:hypothetical protein
MTLFTTLDIFNKTGTPWSSKDDGGQVMEQEYFDIHMPSLKSV